MDQLKSFKVHVYRSKYLKDYYARMSKDDDRVIFDDHVADVLKEQGYHWTDTPRSIYSVEKLYEALAGYAPNKVPSLEMTPALKAGITLARICFGSKGEKLNALPLTADTIVSITSNPMGSPGLTNYGCTKIESVARALERGIQILKGVKVPEPCLAFKRTQFNLKTRLVWGYPYSMTAIEGLIARPLIDKFKGGSTPMVFGMTDGFIGAKLRASSYRKQFAYSLDMSQFDATLSRTLIHQSFRILRTWFDLGEIEPTTGVSVSEIFDQIERYFIFTPIVMPDGNIYLGKKHGVPSGSYFTQMIDSIANTIIAGALSYQFKLDVQPKDIFVLGDDLLIWSDTDVSLDDLSVYASQELKVKLHGEEKSAKFQWNDSIHFIGRDWKQGLPGLDEEGIIQRMVFPERFRRYAKDKEERDRQVRMLILSYAWNYEEAWSIAYDALHGNRNNRNAHGSVDMYVFEGAPTPNVDDFHSGYTRYKLKYGSLQKSQSYPDTVSQFWL